MTATWLMVAPQLARAQQPVQTESASCSDTNTADVAANQQREPPEPTPPPDEADRLFNILPNGATVEAGTIAPPVTHKQMFTWATQESFDTNVFPFVAVVTLFGAGQPAGRYWPRYLTAIADNAVGNYMSTAVMPTFLRQDPRYFQRGDGNFWSRSLYAASRVVVTRSRDGHPQFNLSELGGNTLASTISNVYYPVADRSARNTAVRAASQVLWDAVSYECKEFWPDIRRWLERGRRQETERTDD